MTVGTLWDGVRFSKGVMQRGNWLGDKVSANRQVSLRQHQEEKSAGVT